MKVLFVQRVKGIAGSEKYFLNIIPELRKRGVDCEFVCSRKKAEVSNVAPFIKELEKEGIKVHKILQTQLGLNVPSAIFKLYKKGNFDVLFSHLIHADFWCALVKIFYDKSIPLVSGKHGYSESYQSRYGFQIRKGKNKLYHLVSRIANKQVDKAFAISKALKEVYTGLNILPENKIKVIHYGFHFPETAIPEAQISNKKYASNQLLIIGRLIPVKGHEYAIRAIKEVKKEVPDVKLVIVGDGDAAYTGKLKQLIRREGLESNVSFEGFQSDIHTYIKASKVVLIPSISEGFCVVLLEAFHNKKPVIAFDVPAINEILDHKSGILVPPFKVDQFASSISQLLKKTGLQKEMGEEGHQKLHRQFTPSRMTDQTIELLKSVL